MRSEEREEEERGESQAGDSKKRRWVPPANQPWARFKYGKCDTRGLRKPRFASHRHGNINRLTLTAQPPSHEKESGRSDGRWWDSVSEGASAETSSGFDILQSIEYNLFMILSILSGHLPNSVGVLCDVMSWRATYSA